MTALTVIGPIVAYLVIGAFAGRWAYSWFYRRSGDMTTADLDAGFAAWLMVFLWPLSPIALVVLAMQSWFYAPIGRDQKRARQLEEDARRWDEKRYTGTEAEREMAAELGRLCRERAEDIRP